MENWKKVKFSFTEKTTTNINVFVSNLGRIKTVHDQAKKDNILKCGQTMGYPVFKTRLLKERDETTTKKFNKLRAEALKTEKQIWALKREGAKKADIKATEQLWALQRENVTKFVAADYKKRSIYYSSLVHKLVAEYFLPKPKKNQTVLAHINFVKTDNKVENLQWMSREEHNIHLAKNPARIKFEKAMKKQAKANKK